MNGKLAAFAQRSKIKLKSFGKTLLQFSKVNYLMCAYILASVLIELTGVAVTAGKFYMTDPWLYLTFLDVWLNATNGELSLSLYS